MNTSDRIEQKFQYFKERWERMAYDYRENRTIPMLNDGRKERPSVPMPSDEFIMQLAIEAVKQGGNNE